ncbi:hypothetical protein CONLIGDRAFT_682376 [Coniochaeta ligniaria NRRL 30616]|uniref:Chromosome transmission fidelity protein 4 n=1 Tax=Coniochaeta ligniaria NRRL 30616 TaxID=1408157 RepID=A0A1J7JI59_9PEZI|nr:hypothetical protein CONLIGDRAFT_682376 [Coniochaeta ligniaria NRRL 30616]
MSGSNRLLQSSSNVLKPSAAVGHLRCRLSSPAAGGAATSPLKPTSSPTTKPLTTLQEANPRNLPEVWFNHTLPRPNNNGFFQPSQPNPNPSKGPDDNKVKLGKTLRILQSRLPTLLHTPLPQEILSPSISLHLFPSTHPHLPAVRGRVAYQAALWTSPIAWNRLPGLGNVRLEILSERMVRRPPRREGAVEDQLVVRWRTIGGSSRSLAGLLFQGRDEVVSGKKGVGGGDGPMAPGRGEKVGGAQRPGEGREFTGLFIFEFDKEGRILSHTIEHVEEGGQWERGVGAKVVGLTDWLLGGFKGNGEGSSSPSPAFSSDSKGRGA